MTISKELYNSLIGMFFLHSINKTGVWNEGLLTIEEMREQITSNMLLIKGPEDTTLTWRAE